MEGNGSKEFSPCYNPVCENQRLSRLLHLALSDGGEWKEAAEKVMQRLEVVEEYPLHLTRVVLDPSYQEDVRIFACEKLKNFIGAHWCAADERFVPPEVNSRYKREIKDLLLIGLSEATTKVGRVVADTVGTIVQWDWPQNWPELICTLVSSLNSESEFRVERALNVLRKLDVGKVNNQNIDSVATLLCEMNRIFAMENPYSEDIPCLTCQTFSEVVVVLAKHGEPGVIRSHLRRAILIFCKTSMQTWTSKNCSKELKIGILNALTVWIRCVPKYISAFLADMLPLISETLIDCAKEYRAHVVNERGGCKMIKSAAAEMVNYSDDLVTATVKFTEQLMNGESRYEVKIDDYKLSLGEWVYLQDSLSTPPFLRHLIMLMEVTEKQIQLWDTDFNDFVENDYEMGSKIDRIGLMVQRIIKRAQRQNSSVAKRLIALVMNYLEEENEWRMNGRSRNSRNSWKSYEAFLLAFTLIKHCIILRKIKIWPLYDVGSLLQNVVLADLNNSASHPLLVARCLSVGAMYSREMPRETASAFLEATVNALQGNQPPCVKICAANSVDLWYVSINGGNFHNRSMLLPHVPTIFEGLLALAKDVKSAQVHKIVIKGIVSLIPTDHAFTESAVNRIYSLIETGLFDFNVDEITNRWTVVFDKLMRNAKYTELLKKPLTTTLLNVMTNTPFDESRGSLALRIMLVVLRSPVQPLNDFLIDPLFPTVCNYVVSKDACWTILSDGIAIVQKYLSVAFQRVISYKDSHGKNGAQYILQVYIHALYHKSSMPMFENICDMLIKLIKKYEIREGINDLLRSLLDHMQKEESAQVSSKLLMVYAYLIRRWSDMVFDFLANTLNFEAQKSFLNSVIAKGFCKEYHSVEGEDRETIKLALEKVFDHGVTSPYSPLRQITVRGFRQPIPLLVAIRQLTMRDSSSDESSEDGNSPEY